ncbi:MAG: hypothetical protein M3443_04725 [Actinomycetota bacterium]|nr:hypothetical protein [Actinomycetota bacterium]
MNTAGKLTAFGVALAMTGVAGWSVGSIVGPVVTTASAEAHGTDHGTGHGDTKPSEDLPTGLWSSSGGYTLTPAAPALAGAASQRYEFTVVGPDGAVVIAFDQAHDKRMHLIVVRRDTAAFQHVHPTMAPNGTWAVPLNLSLSGAYRVYADFHPSGGEAVVLGVDLDVAGDYQPKSYPQSTVAKVDDYEVRLDGDLVPGQSSKLTLTVVRNGREVTDLQPYLGAYGHLVALRGGDLAYLHVHPDGAPGDGKTPAGPNVTFFTEVPSVAGYRLFFDFQHEGKVRTAEFAIGSTGYVARDVPTPPAPQAPAPTESDGHGHGHGG